MNIKNNIENIIKKNLPKKRTEHFNGNSMSDMLGNWTTEVYNQALSQINPSLIADEGLKVVVELAKNWAKERREMIDNHEYCKNEGERWENGYDCAMYDILQELNTFSPNKENKN